MDKTNFSNLIKQAKNKSIKTTSQKIVPVKNKLENEMQFSFYIEKKLLKQLKLKAIEEETSIKSLINKSISIFLKIENK